MKLDHCYIGDCRDVMRSMISDGVRAQSVVTSPPYWGLRDYGIAGAFGLERDPLRYLARMRSVFRLVHELLADDGTLWLNMGDSYCTRPNGGIGHNSKLNGGKTPHSEYRRANALRGRALRRVLKHKDLVGMPWLLALALRADGWFLRSDVIWHKPNPTPESVTDRPTKAHEYLFLLTKSEQYYYDAEAIKERTVSLDPSHSSYRPNSAAIAESGRKEYSNKHQMSARSYDAAGRNRRSVWTVTTAPFAGAHFATFPEKLIEPCILAGSRPGDIVFDPFMGAGTVGAVAARLGRRWLGAEINPQYVEMQKPRTVQQGMPL